jgi:hypothetical protein
MSSATRRGLIALSVAFVATGMLFVPRLGIEADEAIVANGLYDHGAAWYSWHIAGVEVPVMLISYLGALKTWLYKGVFLLAAPRPISLRFPMLVFAAAALWFFFEFLDRTIGRRGAWIGTLLLSTDTSYLLLNTADYGPVSLQFLFKLAALVLLMRFHQNVLPPETARRNLAGAFFLFGLGMWDKAVFAWALFGLAAAVFLFPRELRKHATRGNIAVAALAMLAGALPLVVYNIARPLETFRSNAHVGPLELPHKVEILQQTLEGFVMFGFLTASDPGPQPGEPKHWYQSLSLAATKWTGHPHHNLILWAAISAVLSLVLFWKWLWNSPARRPILFGLIACVATWLPMVLTAGAGIGAHHVILMWPFQLLPIAAVLTRIPPAAAVLATALLCGSNLAVTNQYYADLIRNGPTVRWTDAMDPLERYLTDLHPRQIVAADWGIMEAMNLQSEGRLPMAYIDTSSEQAIEDHLRDPLNIFLAHPSGIAYKPAERTALEDLARREQYQEEPLTTIYDRNGRPTFDVFRFRRLHL